MSSSKTKAFRKAKQRKSDIRFKELVHKKTGSKKTPLATSTGYLASEQRKLNKDIGQTYNPYNPKSKKNPGGYEGKHYKGSMDKRLGLKHGSSAQSHYLQHGYGPTKTKLKSGKPKIAIKGWS